MSTIKLAIFCFSLISPFFRPTSSAFLAPITKNPSTQKQSITIYLNTPPHPTNLLLDLGASSTLIDCRSESPPGSLSMPVTDGFNPGRLGSVPGFVFSCNNERTGVVKGSAGLGRSNLSIPAQVSNGNPVFALCMSGSPSAPGVAFFGSGGPYYFFPDEIDLSKHLNYTPLLVGTAPNEYFIGLTSVKVNGKSVDFSPSLLTIDGKGYGGTKLSTTTPYTVLQSSIFRSLTDSFSAALNLTVTEPVKPFEVCYDADNLRSSRTGPAVPTVDFVMDGDAIWRIFGSNSMVRIYKDNVDVLCLGFVDGGPRPKTSVVIGTHQMEDNLLQFDLEKEVLGFSSSALVHGTMCANFNFTTHNDLVG